MPLASVDQIRADFDRLAALEPRVGRMGPHEAWICRHVREPGGRILDLGCGTGVLSRVLACRADSVVGLDLSPGMLERARAHGTGVADLRFVEHDFMRWEPDAPFDYVVSIAALHHMPLTHALLRIERILRPGGTLLVVDILDGIAPSELPHSVLSWLAQWADRRATRPGHALRRQAWRDHGTHDRLLSLRAVRAVYASALPGAQVERCVGWRYRARWTKPC